MRRTWESGRFSSLASLLAGLSTVLLARLPSNLSLNTGRTEMRCACLGHAY